MLFESTMRSRLVKCFDTLLCDGGSCVCILFVTKPTWRNLTVLSCLAELKTNNLKVPNCFNKTDTLGKGKI